MALSELDYAKVFWTALPALLVVLILRAYVLKPAATHRPSPTTDPAPKGTKMAEPFAVPDALAPPKDDPFTLDQLTQYDGTDASKPILLSIKGARPSHRSRMRADRSRASQGQSLTSVQSEKPTAQAADTASSPERMARAGSASLR